MNEQSSYYGSVPLFKCHILPFSMFLFIISLLILLYHWDTGHLISFTSSLILIPKRGSYLLILHPLPLNDLILKHFYFVPIFTAASQASSAICSSMCLIFSVCKVPDSTGANNHMLQKYDLLRVRYWLIPATCQVSLVLDGVRHNTY